jgi:DNA ligase-1
MLNQTLFKRHSNGTIGTWQVEVLYANGSAISIVRRTATKVIGGKGVVTDTEFTKGKNIGRANETTHFEQAMSEGGSKYNKKLDEGYVKTIEEAQVKATNSMGFAKPMLALSIDKVKQWNFPVYASPKFDGHRMLATVVDGQVVLYSRGGKTIDVEHIRMALQITYIDGFWDGATLDGEVYLHGETLQKISSLVKKPKPESKELMYYIYDVISDKPFDHRNFEYIYVSKMADHPKVSGTKQILFFNQEDLDAHHAKNLSEGYEGTMVRHGDTGYEEGKRSKSLMKMKDFQDDEFEIVHAFEGKPNLRHDLKVGMYTCRTKEGKDFDVLAPGDMNQKHGHAVDGYDNVGKYMTVKYFNYTADGVPYLPVALRIREDI